MNSAYITLTSALAKEEVIKKLHRTPPFNLMVTPIASCSQEDGPATFEREEALGDENNNAEEIGEDEFVFGSPSVLDVSCDEVKPVVKVNEDLRLLKQAHFARAMLSFFSRHVPVHLLGAHIHHVGSPLQWMWWTGRSRNETVLFSTTFLLFLAF